MTTETNEDVALRLSCAKCDWTYEHSNPANLNVHSLIHSFRCSSLDDIDVEQVQK